MDGQTGGPTDGWADGRTDTLSKRCEDAYVKLVTSGIESNQNDSPPNTPHNFGTPAVD